MGSTPDPMIDHLLTSAGFASAATDLGRDAMSIFESTQPDFVILHSGNPGDPSLAMCRAIRKKSDVPIIVVSTVGGPAVEEALGAGADTCLVRPVGHHELIARIRALLRRRPPTMRPAEVDSVDHLRVDRTQRVASVAGRRLELSLNEFEILALLVADCGVRVTRREALMNGGLSAKALDMAVRRVRSLLEAEEGWRRLVSVRGVGFRLKQHPGDD